MRQGIGMSGFSVGSVQCPANRVPAGLQIGPGPMHLGTLLVRGAEDMVREEIVADHSRYSPASYLSLSSAWRHYQTLVRPLASGFSHSKFIRIM
jgi:hypothetical protein